MRKSLFIFFMSLSIFACKNEEEKKVYFKNLENKQKLKSEFLVVFGLKGMTISPAGKNMQSTEHGHHHLIINKGPVEKGKRLPHDDNHIHFDKAEEKTILNLKPGEYKLTLQFANGAHQSYGESLSETIEVKVIESF